MTSEIIFSDEIKNQILAVCYISRVVISFIDISKVQMPRRNAMRDNVNAVRSRLPHLSNLSREQIELALLYYESNVDETVSAFTRSMNISLIFENN